MKISISTTWIQYFQISHRIRWIDTHEETERKEVQKKDYEVDGWIQSEADKWAAVVTRDDAAQRDLNRAEFTIDLTDPFTAPFMLEKIYKKTPYRTKKK